LNSIRFFETLAMGRIPILISDDAVLPLEDQIDYAALILRLPEVRIAEIGAFLRDWFARTRPQEIGRRCLDARQTWERLLSPAREAQLVHHCLQQVKASNYQLHVAKAADVAALKHAMGKG
jgi:hypothetical protein